MQRALHATAVAALLLGAGCNAGGARDEPRVWPVQYGISYTVGAAQYDERTSQAAFDTCADLPGASFVGSEDSLPPGLSVRFEGTRTEQEDLETCLRALPDTRLTGPYDVPDGS